MSIFFLPFYTTDGQSCRSGMHACSKYTEHMCKGNAISKDLMQQKPYLNIIRVVERKSLPKVTDETRLWIPPPPIQRIAIH